MKIPNAKTVFLAITDSIKPHRVRIGGLFAFILSVYAAYTWFTPTLYISTQGNDSNPGTKALPLRTIQRGISLLSFGGTLHVSPGTYRETVNISKNGPVSLPISIKGEKGAEILGSEPSSILDWQACTDILCPDIARDNRQHVYIASLHWPEAPTLIAETLHDNENTLLTLARTPNFLVTDANKYHEHWWQTGVAQVSQTVIRDPIHAPALPNISGAKVVIMDGKDRCGTFLYVQDVLRHNAYSDSFNVKYPIGAVTYGNQETGLSEYSKYFIENSLGLLDSPGEWFFDKTKEKLYIWPTKNGNPAYLPIEIAKRKAGIHINRSYVSVKEIAVKYINSNTYDTDGSGGIVISTKDSIHNIGLSHVSVTQSGDGISIETANGGSISGVAMDTLLLDGIAKNGIRIMGASDMYESIRGITIRHAQIAHSGFLINESAILVARSSHIDILDNTIHDVANNGIHITGYEKLNHTTNHILIARNTVERACQNGSGCAAIKIFGGSFTDTHIRDNIVKDNIGWSFCQEAANQKSESAIGIFISNASGVQITDNLVSRNKDTGILVFTRQFPATHNTVAKNTIEYSPIGIVFAGASGETDTDTSANSIRHSNSTVTNNTFKQNDVALLLDPADPATMRISGNIYKDNATALIYGDTSIATPSAIRASFPYWNQ